MDWSFWWGVFAFPLGIAYGFLLARWFYRVQ